MTPVLNIKIIFPIYFSCSTHKWLTFDFGHTDAKSVTIYGKHSGIILYLYIFLPAVEVLNASVINIYRWISSNCTDHSVHLIIRIDPPDTAKIAILP